MIEQGIYTATCNARREPGASGRRFRWHFNHFHGGRLKSLVVQGDDPEQFIVGREYEVRIVGTGNYHGRSE